MSSSPILQIQVLPHGEGLPIPSYQTARAAGLDLYAALDVDLLVHPKQRIAVPTGLCLAIPLGFEGQVRPRSGLSFKHGLTVVNAPGTIDSDYRGEIKVLLINLSNEPFLVVRGMRIAQLVISPVSQVSIQIAEELDATARGDGGFGSTGL